MKNAAYLKAMKQRILAKKDEKDDKPMSKQDKKHMAMKMRAMKEME